MPTRDIVPIHLQRRLLEVGRIRLGKKVEMRNGKSRPAKLDKFRLTSRDKARLDSAAALYGGTVEPWEDQFQLFTEVDEFPVAVVPQQALSVAYELWGQVTIKGQKSPVICLRRCDGVDCMARVGENLVSKPCLCAGEEDTSCRPVTRVSVILSDVAGIGVWRVESHGWNALTEMQGQVELLEQLVATGLPIKARLRLERRQTHTARGVNKFAVPVLDIDHTVNQVLAALQQGAPMPVLALPDSPLPVLEPAAPPALEAPAAAAPAAAPNPNIGTVPPASSPAPSVREQLAAARDQEPPARSNAAEPIASTGAQPRSVDQLGDDEVDQQAEAPAGDAAAPDGEGVLTTPPSGGGALPLEAQVAIWIGDVRQALIDQGVEVPKADDFRHRFLEAFSEGEYASAKKVPRDADVVNALRAACVRLRRGTILLCEVERDPGITRWVFRDAATRLPTNDPGGQSKARRGGPVDPDADADDNVIDIGDKRPTEQLELPPADATDDTVALFWKRQFDQVDGIGAAKLLKFARTASADLGITPPDALGELRDPALSEQVLLWLRGPH